MTVSAFIGTCTVFLSGMQGCNVPSVSSAGPPQSQAPYYEHSAFMKACTNQEMLGLPSFNGWKPTSIPAAADMSAETNPNPVQINSGVGNMYVFYQDSTGRIAYRAWNTVGGWWGGINTIGADKFTSDPIPVPSVGGAWVFANKSDGTIWYTIVP